MIIAVLLAPPPHIIEQKDEIIALFLLKPTRVHIVEYADETMANEAPERPAIKLVSPEISDELHTLPHVVDLYDDIIAAPQFCPPIPNIWDLEEAITEPTVLDAPDDAVEPNEDMIDKFLDEQVILLQHPPSIID